MVGGLALAPRGRSAGDSDKPPPPPPPQSPPPAADAAAWGAKNWGNHSSAPPQSSSPWSSSPPSHLPSATAPNNAGHDGLHPGHAPLPYGAIVLPPLILVALIAALLFSLRSRRRRRRLQQQQQEDPPPAPPPHPEVREYRSSQHPPTVDFTLPFSSSSIAPPIILSSSNNAYLTGLDTPSQGSIRGSEDGETPDADYPPARRSLGGTTFEEPPPPYKADGSVHNVDRDPPPPIEYGEIAAPAVDRTRSPFEDPEYEVDVADGMMFDEQQRHRSPFDDPDSPVSEIDIGSRMMLARRMSDVSDL